MDPAGSWWQYSSISCQYIEYINAMFTISAVSYTHLDVYKRQIERHRKKAMLDSAKSKKLKKKKARLEEDMSLYEQAAARRNRAAAPAQTTTDYKFAPTSNLSSISTGVRTAGVGSTLNNSEMYKRLNARLSKSKRTK